MTREELAVKIGWEYIIWTFGIINVLAMLPQLIQILRTNETEGLAVEMFAIYLVIQIAFAIEGFFKRSLVLLICMALSALMSTTIISLIFYFRHFAG